MKKTALLSTKAANALTRKERRALRKSRRGDGDGLPKRHHLDPHASAIIQAGDGSDDDLLTTGEMGTWFRKSKQWFEIGRSKGYGPPFVRLSSQVVRYRRGDVKAWLAERRHASTAEYSGR